MPKLKFRWEVKKKQFTTLGRKFLLEYNNSKCLMPIKCVFEQRVPMECNWITSTALSLKFKFCYCKDEILFELLQFD